MRVAVAGGTGLVGRLVVDALSAAGHEPVVLARSTGVDLVAGTGVEEAVAGAAAVVDVSNVPTLRQAPAEAFFTAATTALLEAGRRAGVRHHVVLSIVGVDRVAQGYYRAKAAQERLVLGGPVPGSVLRATQFHEFAGQLLDRSRGPLVVVPRMRVQPVAAREVAAALVELAVGEPAGATPELAGPEVHELTDLARRVLGARGDRRVLVPLRLPGAVGRQLAGGALLPAGPGGRGVETFDAWLRRTTA
jgi:uncharacterized protein YbjT (DUF2867 family)